MKSLLLLAFICSLSFIAVKVDAQATPLNVHIIAHTHDDVGWLKTVDEYYYGANNTIQYAGVQYILDTVVDQLLLNPKRRFIYVEIAYFMRWWREQTLERQEIVKELVRTGQLEFCNAGWTMNDEACTFYPEIISQMTEGHRFVYENFGARPTIGWQIDPFGHSSTMASLFSQMGMNAVFFARSDYQDYLRRNATSELEFIWRPSVSLGNKTDLFTHILYDSTYCEPYGFSFQDADVQPVKADPRLEGYNIPDIAQQLANIVYQRSASFRTSNILITFGCDFQYMDAIMNFKNMDLLMDYINARKTQFNLNIFYSTPSTYLAAVHEEANRNNIAFTLNQFDFFPYRDDPYAVWAGYFTSRSALKGYVRTRSALLQGTTALLTTASGLLPNVLNLKNYDMADLMAQVAGVTTHHDAVTGTEKEHVAKDYAKQLAIGSHAAHTLIGSLTGQLLARSTPDEKLDPTLPAAVPPSFNFCLLLNVSICPATSVLSSASAALPIVLYNPLSWRRTSYIRLPVPVSNVDIIDETGTIVASQVYPNEDISGVYTLAFSVDLPPLGFRSLVIQQGFGSEKADMFQFAPQDGAPDVVIENEYLRVTVSGTTGRLSGIVNKVSNAAVNVDQNLLWYNASAGNNVNSSQTSGAYIFRPNGTHPWNLTTNNIAQIVTVVKGPLVQEVRQFWTSWGYQTLRLYDGAQFLEAESTIGPIPINDNLGKEVITQYTTNLNSQSLWYTDSNGQEFQQRKRNYRPTYNLNVTEPVALNYFPADAAGYLEDTTTNTRFSLITDRATGCGSLNDGQIEMMIHRRLLYDDYRGVGEPLNQSDIVRATHWSVVERRPSSARLVRPLMLELSYPAEIMFANYTGTAQQWFTTYKTNFSPLAQDLPFPVQLLTLRTINTGETVLRLFHMFAVGEDAVYSKNVTVDLGALFKDLQISSIREMTLTANLPIDDMHRYKWLVGGEEEEYYQAMEEERQSVETPEAPAPPQAPVYTLSPMQIRTFNIRYLNA